MGAFNALRVWKILENRSVDEIVVVDVVVRANFSKKSRALRLQSKLKSS